MELVKCPEEFKGKGRSVFLAGGISNCSDWQSEISKMFEEEDLVLINPRRDDYDFDDLRVEEEQINWEFRHLEKSDVILFWFPCETLCPITLYELGKVSNSKKKIFVGIHPEYSRRRDVEIQTSLIRPEVKIVYSLGDLAQEVKNGC